MKNIFQPAVNKEVIEIINKLSPNTSQLWGKMNVSQMLAHCNVSYQLVYDSKHAKPNL
ncbi:hypothetical protein [Pedobacter sp. Leaf41]|uniref:hypothetical protein n=1 Tax=Pedobacter sp. Leaf41 TaxID=1736218 RepID=UPI000AC2960B|nr:hypothetical protein [Pedobacter sp. Leaf41]